MAAIDIEIAILIEMRTLQGLWKKGKTMRRKNRKKSKIYFIKRAIKKYGVPKKLKML